MVHNKHRFFIFWISLNLSVKSVFIMYHRGVSKFKKKILSTIKECFYKFYQEVLLFNVLSRSVNQFPLTGWKKKRKVDISVIFFYYTVATFMATVRNFLHCWDTLFLSKKQVGLDQLFSPWRSYPYP